MTAELTGDEEMLNDANEALYYNGLIGKKMWRDREMAVAFIQGYKAIGF